MCGEQLGCSLHKKKNARLARTVGRAVTEEVTQNELTGRLMIQDIPCSWSPDHRAPAPVFCGVSSEKETYLDEYIVPRKVC